MPVIIDKCGPDGEAFTIMRRVKEIMLDAGRANEWEEVRHHMMAVPYSELCAFAEEVTLGSIKIIDSRSEKWQQLI